MNRLLSLLLCVTAFLTGCLPPPSQIVDGYRPQHRAEIVKLLGGQVEVADVAPPVGPFDLVDEWSAYYRATVKQNGKVYYVRVKPSVLGGVDQPAYLFYSRLLNVGPYTRDLL